MGYFARVMSFFSSMLNRPGPSTPLSKFTERCGLLYLVLGASIFAWPGQFQLVGVAPFQGQEEGLARIIGFTVIVVGWFYVMGGRTGATSFGLATVLDRLLVPLFLIPLGVLGQVAWPIALPFAILDPALGLVAFIIWRRTKA